jgi:hypothetical protein
MSERPQLDPKNADAIERLIKKLGGTVPPKSEPNPSTPPTAIPPTEK